MICGELEFRPRMKLNVPWPAPPGHLGPDHEPLTAARACTLRSPHKAGQSPPLNFICSGWLSKGAEVSQFTALQSRRKGRWQRQQPAPDVEPELTVSAPAHPACCVLANRNTPSGTKDTSHRKLAAFRTRLALLSMTPSANRGGLAPHGSGLVVRPTPLTTATTSNDPTSPSARERHIPRRTPRERNRPHTHSSAPRCCGCFVRENVRKSCA
jgi:hypothetical protein